MPLFNPDFCESRWGSDDRRTRLPPASTAGNVRHGGQDAQEHDGRCQGRAKTRRWADMAQKPRNARGARKPPPTWLLASLAGLLGASGRHSPPGSRRSSLRPVLGLYTTRQNRVSVTPNTPGFCRFVQCTSRTGRRAEKTGNQAISRVFWVVYKKWLSCLGKPLLYPLSYRRVNC